MKVYECIFGGAIPKDVYDWCDTLCEYISSHVAFDEDRIWVSGEHALSLVDVLRTQYGAICFTYESVEINNPTS